MLSSLTPIQSRIVASAILLLLFLIILVAAIYPVWSLNATYDEQISDDQHQIKIYQRIASQDNQYQQEFSNLKRNQQTDRRYLQSNTDSLAKAELQRRMKLVAAKKNGEIISTQAVQVTQEEDLNRVAIRVRMKSTLENMKAILHQLETEKPYLFVENIMVRSRHVTRRRLPKTKEITKAISMLDVEFLLSGYLKRGES
ncbi:MAG: type II secretion system protein M [Candidatus Thiodiazotropha sp. (ex Ustalcina ferruginea)]|nr:type II secretion system protein M [Candidatus Thiodiazotropha sp. (ex Ustalcina ferruginea)]